MARLSLSLLLVLGVSGEKQFWRGTQRCAAARTQPAGSRLSDAAPAACSLALLRVRRAKQCKMCEFMVSQIASEVEWSVETEAYEAVRHSPLLMLPLRSAADAPAPFR